MRKVSATLFWLAVLATACTGAEENESTDSSEGNRESATTAEVVETTEPAPFGWSSRSLGIGEEAEPLGVWSTGEGFVMASIVGVGDQRHVALWRSVDGLEWTQDPEPSPPVRHRPHVDVGPTGAVALVTGGYYSQALAFTMDGEAWSIAEPDSDWGPKHWQNRDGYEFVHTGYSYGDIEVGPQGILVSVTQHSWLDFEAAARDSLPEITSQYESIMVGRDLDSDVVEIVGVRVLPEADCSMCGLCTQWDLAWEPLGTFTYADISVDPTLAIEVRNHSHARWIWRSTNFEDWTLDQMIVNDGEEHEAVGELLDTGDDYYGSIGGDLAYSPDGVSWSSSVQRSGDRYFSVRDLAWSGSELVVGASAHNAIGDSDDSYDIWAGVFDDLRPVVVAPEDSLFARAYPGMEFRLAAGPAGTLVAGTDEDASPRASSVWLLRDGERIEHETGPVTGAAVGQDRVVILGDFEAAEQDSICESALSIETYILGD